MVRKKMAIASLLLMWVVCGSLTAQPREAVLPEGQWPRKLTERGETAETAKAVAFRKAVDVINARLKAFVVTEDYVRQHLVDQSREGDEDKIQLAGIEHVFKQWILTFRTDPDCWRDLVHHDREAERKLSAEERQTLTSRVMLGLALVLLAGVGYVRLDDYTQRRYTGLLRLAGFGLASMVAAGMWLFFFQAPG
jgi:hypothetical protein